MKKSTLFGLAMLGAGAGLFLHLLFGPLDEDLKREAQGEIALAQKFLDSHSQRTKSLNALLKKYPKLKEVPAVEEDLAFLRRETRRIEQIRPLVKSLKEGLKEDSGLNEGDFRDQMVSLQLTVSTGILLGVYREGALKTPLTNTHASAAEGGSKPLQMVRQPAEGPQDTRSQMGTTRPKKHFGHHGHRSKTARRSLCRQCASRFGFKDATRPSGKPCLGRGNFAKKTSGECVEAFVALWDASNATQYNTYRDREGICGLAKPHERGAKRYRQIACGYGRR